MKKYLPFYFVFAYAFGQAPNEVYLDINQVKAFITNDATNFYKATNGNNWNYQGYEVPKGSGKKCDFANCLWIAGRDANNNLKVAGQRYGGVQLDFWPGPLDSNGNSPLNGMPYFINKRFKVNKTTIDSFKLAWQIGTIQNGSYAIPNSISMWPGNNPLYQTEILAPFFDFNNDGIYAPNLGDYPLIKGDQAIFAVYNDKANLKTASAGPAMGLEIRRLSYAYYCDNLAPNLEVVNYTTFHEYTIINKNNLAYDSLFVGMFFDSNIGNQHDDYIGCDVQNEVAYHYNADSIDETIGNTSGYQSQTPIYACKLLRTASNDGLDSDGDNLVDELDEKSIREMRGFIYYLSAPSISVPNMAEPISANEYYNYLNNKFRNGTPLIYGRSGFPVIGGSNVPSQYCFPGLSDPQNLGTNYNISGPGPIDPTGSSLLINGGWTESNNGGANPLPSGMKYPILNTRITNLPVGGSRQLKVALIFTPNPQSKNFAALLPQAEQDWKTITTLYETNSLSNNCGTPVNLKAIEKNKNPFKLYPNPSQEQVFITGLKKGKQTIFVKVYDIHGNLVKTHTETTTEDFIQLELKNLDTGLYFVKINNEKMLKLIKTDF